jgi:nucleotide-binding universal stress UspA family protein
MIRTILVPVDGSGHAEQAVALAADLASKDRAHIALFHVLLLGHVPDSLRALSGKHAEAEGGELPREIRVDIAEQLLERARRIAEYHGATRVDTAWAEGPVTQRILEQAEDVGADMIVLGSRGLSDLKSLMVGSVAHKVAHLFEGSVVIVR